MSTNASNLHNMVPSKVDVLQYPHFMYIKKQRQKSELTYQGHLISKWQNQESNTRYLALESTLV